MKDTQPTSTTLEFSVDMTCSNCEQKVATALEKGGIADYKVLKPDRNLNFDYNILHRLTLLVRRWL